MYKNENSDISNRDKNMYVYYNIILIQHLLRMSYLIRLRRKFLRITSKYNNLNLA